MEKINWIWLDVWEAADREKAVLALFRRKVQIMGKHAKGTLKISADSRYKLFVNGRLVEAGPSKGDLQVWYMDEVDVSPYLRAGENVLAVQVLRYPAMHGKGNYGIFRTEYPGFFAEGAIRDSEGNCICLDASEGWKCRRDNCFHIVSEHDSFAPLQISEDTGGDWQLAGWKEPGYDEKGWKEPYRYPAINQAVSPGNLYPRTIPFLYRRKKQFEGIVQTLDAVVSQKEWEDFIAGEKSITIPVHSNVAVEISADAEQTGYLHLAMEKGADADIVILESEAYVLGGEQGDLKVPYKGDRKDYKTGYLNGFTDRYRCAGYGREGFPEIYEPFWFRTFRFLRLSIKTKEQPLTLSRFDYTETGYPLEVKTQACASDPRFDDIWEISERTLRRCMHETYEDCPFYEQLQYSMDARTQILFTYTIAADDRLARKCMDDLQRSQRYDGLLNSAHPCYEPNIIPGFSIYYILMLYDHMMYFGDRELLFDHMPTVERILNFFHRNLTEEGYVGKIGGINGKARFWSFVDWAPAWKETSGIPPATLQGPITMESLLYVMGLQCAAKIAEYLGWKESEERFQARAFLVQEAVRKHCMGNNGMLMDGPGIAEYCQQTQVFAALTDTVFGKQARDNLKETLVQKEKYPQCSVAMSFYLFRALQKVGLYEDTRDCWDVWQRMIEKHASTCVEDDVQERSECHAWGALILYELPAVILGVRPARPGYQAVEIQPEPGYLESASGRVITPRGMVSVAWSRDFEGIHVNYHAPKGLEVITSFSDEGNDWKE